MFFKKRKQKQAQERSGRRAEMEKAFHAAIHKAGLMEDPAEKIIRLQEIDRLITNYLRQETREVANKAVNADLKAFGSGTAASLGTVYSALLFTGPLGWTVLGAGTALFGGTMVGSRMYSKSVEKKMTQEAADHVQKMKLLQAVIDVVTDVTIENNLKEISKSPLSEKVHALPRLTKKFAAAAAKHFAADEAPVVEESTLPAGDNNKNTPPKRQTSNFRYTKGALRKPQNPDSKP